jgi:hypothetical protein
LQNYTSFKKHSHSNFVLYNYEKMIADKAKIWIEIRVKSSGTGSDNALYLQTI